MSCPYDSVYIYILNCESARERNAQNVKAVYWLELYVLQNKHKVALLWVYTL